jgi:hypothetical protein
MGSRFRKSRHGLTLFVRLAPLRCGGPQVDWALRLEAAAFRTHADPGHGSSHWALGAHGKHQGKLDGASHSLKRNVIFIREFFGQRLFFGLHQEPTSV